MYWTTWFVLLVGMALGAGLALALTGTFVVLGLVYFEKKREVRNIVLAEEKERDLASRASAQHQRHRGVVAVAEQRGRVKFQTGTQRGYVNYYEVPWSFAVLKANMLFQFRDAQSTGCSASVRLDGASVKVVHWIKSGGRTCSKYHRKSAIRITAAGDAQLVPGERAIFLYFFRGYEMDEWLYALKRAARLVAMPDDLARRYELEHQHFMHLNTILTTGEPVAADWLNALLGRIFWGVHDNPFVLKMLKKGLQAKINRMKKPTFPLVQVQSINVMNTALGPNVPVFSGIVLNSLSPQGALSFDLDVLYHGGFQLDLEIILAFTVPLTKKVVLIPVQSYTSVRCVAGRVNFRAAPPPSVKSWIGFYGLPRVDVDIRTEVGKKQSNFLLRDLPAIARVVTVKIKEKLLKKIVLPTMEDFPLPAVPKKFTRQALEELAAADKASPASAADDPSTATGPAVAEDFAASQAIAVGAAAAVAAASTEADDSARFRSAPLPSLALEEPKAHKTLPPLPAPTAAAAPKPESAASKLVAAPPPEVPAKSVSQRAALLASSPAVALTAETAAFAPPEDPRARLTVSTPDTTSIRTAAVLAPARRDLDLGVLSDTGGDLRHPAAAAALVAVGAAETASEPAEAWRPKPASAPASAPASSVPAPGPAPLPVPKRVARPQTVSLE